MSNVGNGLKAIKEANDFQNIEDQKAINLTWFISKFEGQEHFPLTTKHKKGLYLLQTIYDGNLWVVNKNIMVNGHYHVHVLSDTIVSGLLNKLGYVWVGRLGTWEKRN